MNEGHESFVGCWKKSTRLTREKDSSIWTWTATALAKGSLVMHCAVLAR